MSLLNKSNKADKSGSASGKTRLSNWVDWATDKRTITQLIIFAVLAAAATIGAIVWTNDSLDNSASQDITLGQAESPSDNKNIPDESKLAVVRGDIYATNPLQITDIPGEQQYSVTYQQISGLKNQDVQNKINDQLRATYDQINSGALANGANMKSVSCNTSANFGNILSVTCNRTDQNKHGVGYNVTYDTISEKHAYLNFRLDTGEQIKFSDVFTAGANMNQLVTTAFYETWSSDSDHFECADGTAIDNNNDPWCGNHGGLQPVYPADIEERALAAVQAFKNQSQTDFYLTASDVTFMVGDQKLTLNFLDNSKYIAIYKRFANAGDLYDGQFDGQYGFVFQPAFRLALGKIGDNLFVDCISMQNDSTYLQQEKKLIDQRIAAAKTDAAKHPDQITALICSTNYSDQTGVFNYANYSSFSFRVNTGITLSSAVFTMSKDYFDKTGWGKILDANYAPHVEANTYSSGAFESYDSVSSQLIVNEGVTRTTDNQAWFLVNGAWTDLTAEYSKWVQTECASRSGTFDDDGGYYCRFN